jgi:hypothetical protein
MEWTLFEFIETFSCDALQWRGSLLMMMHEDWGTTQNYVVADAGEGWICRPVRYRNGKGIRGGWESSAVEKRVCPLRYSR